MIRLSRIIAAAIVLSIAPSSSLSIGWESDGTDDGFLKAVCSTGEFFTPSGDTTWTYTICGWFSIPDGHTEGDVMRIFGHYRTNSTSYGFRGIIYSNPSLYNGWRNQGISRINVEETSNLNAGADQTYTKWQFYAFRARYTDAYLYLGDPYVEEDFRGDNLGQPTNIKGIGFMADWLESGSDLFNNGQMGVTDWQIYQGYLTEEEIAAIRYRPRSPLFTSNADVKAHWSMSTREGDGNNLSGNIPGTVTDVPLEPDTGASANPRVRESTVPRAPVVLTY